MNSFLALGPPHIRNPAGVPEKSACNPISFSNRVGLQVVGGRLAFFSAGVLAAEGLHGRAARLCRPARPLACTASLRRLAGGGRPEISRIRRSPALGSERGWGQGLDGGTCARRGPCTTFWPEG